MIARKLSTLNRVNNLKADRMPIEVARLRITYIIVFLKIAKVGKFVIGVLSKKEKPQQSYGQSAFS